ncbi:MAG: hypothetical protein KBF63_21285 [Rhodoferax sp.]|jgi:hypothetical protein|nr:hypothetical protein [Rhodoferax sp.]HQZ07452.1 hypothetical protein [Burkholderiaceae bacterium]
MIDHSQILSRSVARKLAADPLHEAIATISRSFGGVDAERVGSTPVTRFRAGYAQVLKEVDQGQPQVVVQGSRRFVVFSEEQVVAFADLHGKDQTVGDLLQGLPLLDAGTQPIRADTPEPAHDAYALGART